MVIFMHVPSLLILNSSKINPDFDFATDWMHLISASAIVISTLILHSVASPKV